MGTFPSILGIFDEVRTARGKILLRLVHRLQKYALISNALGIFSHIQLGRRVFRSGHICALDHMRREFYHESDQADLLELDWAISVQIEICHLVHKLSMLSATEELPTNRESAQVENCAYVSQSKYESALQVSGRRVQCESQIRS
jgi:hypothetical protein